MIQAPERLFSKATALGFCCSTKWQEHKIAPADPVANWHLIYKSGHWTLFVNGVAQMNLRYSEVNDFLDRRAQAQSPSAVMSA